MKRFIAILMFAGALIACDKTTQEASKLDVGDSEITVPSKANVAQVNVSSDGQWTAELSEKWVVASKMSGDGNDVIKLAVMANTDYSSRQATMTLRAGSLTRTVTIIQSQMDGIIIDGADVNASYEGGEINLPVKTNVSIKTAVEVPWITITETKALSDVTIPITVALNPGREGRVGHVTVTGEGIEKVFNVKQGAFEPEFDLVDELGVGLWGTLSSPVEGMTYTFTAVTNMDFYAEAPDADWIDVVKEGDVVTVTIAPNDGAARSEYIYMGCSKEDVDYSDFGAMIQVAQKGQASAVEMWKMDFFWGIFPNSTRVSTAIAGDNYVIFSPKAETAGFHLISREDGSELSVIPSAVENVTGITNDDEGNIIITTGGNFPIDTDTWALIEDQQIPLQVYVMSAEDFLAGNYGEPILTYYDGFYGYGLDNAKVSGNALGDGLLTMTSGAAGGGSYSVAWEIRGGKTTDNPTAFAVAPTDGGDCWDSFHSVNIGVGSSVNDGIFYAGYVGDYNLHFSQTLGDAASWSTAFTTGYTWEGAINSGDVFTYNGHKYLAVLGMNYFAFADWDYDGTVDGYMPSTIWVMNIDKPSAPILVIKEDYYATEGNGQYGSNTDIKVVEEDGILVAYVMDAATSTYRKFELQM